MLGGQGVEGWVAVMDGRPMSPTIAYGWSTIDLMRERADCIVAGECVHDHINGACPYSGESDR